MIGLSCLALLHAAATDLIRFEIGNWNSILIAACYPIAAIGAGLPWAQIGTNVGAGAAVLAIGFLLFWRGYLGGGDVKLLAALAIWVGWRALPAFIFWVAIYGGVLAIVILIIRRSARLERFRGTAWVTRIKQSPAKLPYGVAIAAGAGHILVNLPIIKSTLEPILGATAGL